MPDFTPRQALLLSLIVREFVKSPKNSGVSVSYMIGHLAPLVSGMEEHADDLDRNSCDAIINAYTGQLHAQSNTDVLGDPEEGILVLPKLPN